MTEVTYEFEGTERTVAAADGESLMRVALQNDIPGIIGECGGELSCGTCHIYVGADWSDRIPPRSRDEEDLLDMIDTATAESRLGCQIFVDPTLDGFHARVAEES